MEPVRVRDFRPTPLDPPISVFLPENRHDWLVVAVSTEDMPDRKGSEVHRFRHWTARTSTSESRNPMSRDPLAEMLTQNGIRSVTGARGGGLSVRFGSSVVKNLSDGQFPVEVYRCMKMGDGKLIEEHRRTVKLPHRLHLATSDAGRGWRHGAEEQWVEVRTPKNRQETR